jgi:hypothetical protein
VAQVAGEHCITLLNSASGDHQIVEGQHMASIYGESISAFASTILWTLALLPFLFRSFLLAELIRRLPDDVAFQSELHLPCYQRLMVQPPLK